MNDVAAALVLTTLAGLATGLGGLIIYLIPSPNLRYLSLGLGFAAGVMIYVAFVDLFTSSREVIGLGQANLFFLAGILSMWLLDRVLPHAHLDGRPDSQSSLMSHGALMTFIGIALHNFPEGMMVAMVTLSDLRMGLPVALAIAIHNVPEGLACAIPAYCATGSRQRSLALSFLAGLAEPLGAVLALLIFLPFLSPHNLAASIAWVAGVMVFICFDEMIPIANRYGDEHLSSGGIILGIMTMMVGLMLFE